MSSPAAAHGGAPPFPLTFSGVLRRSIRPFFSKTASLLFVSLLLFSFRSALLSASLSLYSLLDRRPALLILLRRLSSPPPPPPPPPPRPLLRLRFPSDDPLISPLSSPSSSSNASIFFLSPANSLPRIPTSLPSYQPNSPVTFIFPDPRPRAENTAIDRGEATALLYLLTLLTSTHSAAILGFVVVHSVALGMVFVSTAYYYLNHRDGSSLFTGARLGILRLTGFAFLKWALRDTLIQVLSILFLSEVEDQSRLFKLFVKVKFTPFLISSGGTKEPELTELLMVWSVIDMLVSVVLSFVPWILIMERNEGQRRGGRDVIQEGMVLVGLVFTEALKIKCFEILVCGNPGAWILTAVGGRVFSRLVQAVAEVYFMVAWFLLYLGARWKEGELRRRPFRLQDLAEDINGLR